jgi:hypothetical protein
VSELIQLIEWVRGALTGAEWRRFNAHFNTHHVAGKSIDETMADVPGAPGR